MLKRSFFLLAAVMLVAAAAHAQGIRFEHDKDLAIDDRGFYYYPLEAESFACADGGWTVQWQGYCNGSPNYYSRNLLVADASPKPAQATRQVTIRKAGDHAVFIRYSKPYGFGTVFGVRLEQAGKTLLDKRYGCKSDVILNPFRGRTAMEEWYYHGSDPVFALPETVALAEGPLTITLYKDENEGPGARREIDFICLTTELQARPRGRLYGRPTLWASETIFNKFRAPFWYKVILEEKPEKPVQISVQDGKWMVNGYYAGPKDDFSCLCIAEGAPVWRRLERKYLGKGLGFTFLKPAKENIAVTLADKLESPWRRVDVSSVEPPCFLVTADGAPVKARFLIADAEPCEQHVIWSGWPEGKKTFEVICPIGNGTYEHDNVLAAGRPVTLDELLADQAARVRAHAVAGRPPRLFATCGTPTIQGLDLHTAQGNNGAYYLTPPEVYAPEAAQKLGSYTRFVYPNGTGVPAASTGDAKKWVEAKENRAKDPTGYIPRNYKLIEEASAAGLDALAKDEKNHEAFRALARERGIDPALLLTAETWRELAGKNLPKEELWKYVKLGTGSQGEAYATPELYYHSVYFRGWAHSEEFRRLTATIHGTFPQDRTNPGATIFSDGEGVGLHRGIDPFLCFQRGAFTAYLSENSWGRDGANYIGPQSMSYEGCLMRSLTKYGDFPLGAHTTYLIVSGVHGFSANAENYIPLQGLCGFAQGFDGYFYYSGGRDVSSHLFHSSILKAIKTVNYSVGAVEDDLLGAKAKVVKAPVALGWSVSTDIWDLTVKPRGQVGTMLMENNIYPQERHHLYYILRHCQTPVDILDERDIEDGRLDGYKLYVLVGDHLSRKAAAKLIGWVQQGGTVLSVAGGGLWDEYNRENADMLALFGVAAAPVRKVDVALRPKSELLHHTPLETALFPEGGMDCYGYLQSITLPKEKPTAQVLAKTYGGANVAVANPVGKGRAILCGFLPGMAYLKSAMPLWPFGKGGREELSSFITTNYPPAVRAVFKKWLADAGVENPVECVEPLVEPTLWKGEDGKHRLCLVNCSLKPIPALKITTRGLTYTRVLDSATGQPVAGAGPEFSVAIDQFKVLRFE